MEFMLLFLVPPGTPTPESADMAEMTRYAGELADQGKLRRGAPLADDAHGARVRSDEGRVLLTDGPFAEAKEVVGGFWIVDVADRDEAIAIAARAPHARHGVVDVHLLEARYVFADAGAGTPHLLTFYMVPDLRDPDGSKMREMVAFDEELVRQGTLIETAPLADEPPAARVQVRGGQTLVTDGPYAETKEGVGGYSIVRTDDRAAAVDVARRYPHAKWGPVEVREILFFDRT